MRAQRRHARTQSSGSLLPNLHTILPQTFLPHTVRTEQFPLHTARPQTIPTPDSPARGARLSRAARSSKVRRRPLAPPTRSSPCGPAELQPTRPGPQPKRGPSARRAPRPLAPKFPLHCGPLECINNWAQLAKSGLTLCLECQSERVCFPGEVCCPLETLRPLGSLCWAAASPLWSPASFRADQLTLGPATRLALKTLAPNSGPPLWLFSSTFFASTADEQPNSCSAANLAPSEKPQKAARKATFGPGGPFGQ